MLPDKLVETTIEQLKQQINKYVSTRPEREIHVNWMLGEPSAYHVCPLSEAIPELAKKALEKSKVYEVSV